MNPALGKQKQVDAYEFNASVLIYRLLGQPRYIVRPFIKKNTEQYPQSMKQNQKTNI